MHAVPTKYCLIPTNDKCTTRPAPPKKIPTQASKTKTYSMLLEEQDSEEEEEVPPIRRIWIQYLKIYLEDLLEQGTSEAEEEVAGLGRISKGTRI